MKWSWILCVCYNTLFYWCMPHKFYFTFWSLTKRDFDCFPLQMQLHFYFYSSCKRFKMLLKRTETFRGRNGKFKKRVIIIEVKLTHTHTQNINMYIYIHAIICFINKLYSSTSLGVEFSTDTFMDLEDLLFLQIMILRK